MRSLACLAAGLVVASNAWGVHKCVGPDGRVTYSDTLCSATPGEVKVDHNSLPPAESGRTGPYVREAQRQQQEEEAQRRVHDQQQEHARRIRDAAAADEARRKAAQADVRSTITPGTFQPGGGTPIPTSPSTRMR